MDALLAISLAFPTLAFTIVLVVCLLYWLTAATGLIEFDGLDGLLGLDLDLGLDADPSGLAAILARLGLGGVPVMLVITVLAYFSWTGSYLVQWLVLGALPAGAIRLLGGLATLVLAPVPAAGVTAVVLRPLRRWLIRMRPPPTTSLLGRVVVIRTATVDPGHGMADLDDGGAGLILQVRSDGPGLQRGDRAVLLGYESSTNTWQVAPEGDLPPLN